MPGELRVVVGVQDGRSTSCSSLSDQVGSPSGRRFPFAFGMYVRWTGVQRYRSKRTASMMASIFARLVPSAVSVVAPGVIAPRLRAILPYASRYRSRWKSKIDALQRQSSPAAVADDPQERLGVPHPAYLLPGARRHLPCRPVPESALALFRGLPLRPVDGFPSAEANVTPATTMGAPSP